MVTTHVDTTHVETALIETTCMDTNQVEIFRLSQVDTESVEATYVETAYPITAHAEVASIETTPVEATTYVGQVVDTGILRITSRLNFTYGGRSPVGMILALLYPWLPVIPRRLCLNSSKGGNFSLENCRVRGLFVSGRLRLGLRLILLATSCLLALLEYCVVVRRRGFVKWDTENRSPDTEIRSGF